VTVPDENFLAEQFETHRSRLTSLACRILGSRVEAEDAVQEVWLRLSRPDADIDNLGGWLTTVVGRLCLDMLRTRQSRREDPLEALNDEPTTAVSGADLTGNPDGLIEIADSVGLAMQTVLERLTPAERVTFVLHDMFAVPFEDIAPVIGRSPDAARQLASRARRRVQGAKVDEVADRARRREIVEAFITASRGGDFKALLTVLDPDVVLKGDAEVVRLSGRSEVRGAHDVAAAFKGRAQAARPAMVDGALEIAVVPEGRLFLVFRLRIENGRIAAIHATADPATLARCEISLLDFESTVGHQ
jgi:RNA polymerase sigma-70 factor (ECF subfamily)